MNNILRDNIIPVLYQEHLFCTYCGLEIKATLPRKTFFYKKKFEKKRLILALNLQDLHTKVELGLLCCLLLENKMAS